MYRIRGESGRPIRWLTSGDPVDRPALAAYWRYKQPNDYGGVQDCVLVEAGSPPPKMVLNDYVCKNKHSFICQSLKGE